MNKNKEIYITVNSPGEIAGWLKPAVLQLKKELPDYKFKVLLLPCVFASGNEKNVLAAIPEIDEIIPAAKFISLFMDTTERTNTFFLHFGGDLALTAMLAKRWKTFAWGYQWGTVASDPFYKGYFVKTEYDRDVILKRGLPAAKIHITGDLLYDAVMNNIPEEARIYSFDGVKTIAFMGGSRDVELRALLPFYLKTARLLTEKYGKLNFKAIISPFIHWDELLSIGTLKPIKGLDGLSGVIDKDKKLFISLDDPDLFVELVNKEQYLNMYRSDFIISIPGTKTGEAACLNKPMLVIMPLNRPDHIPFVGLIGLLDWVPLFGKWLKGQIVLIVGRNFGFVSQPNILAGKEVVPEMMGVLAPEDLIERISPLMGDKQSCIAMKEKLSEMYSPFEGASKRLSRLFVDSVLGIERKDLPYFSVVICSRNRKQLLKGTIETLDEQTIPSSSYEIIIVDDGSEDGTDEMVASLTTKCKLRYILKTWGGRSETRNVGIEAAQGEIVVFVDDDIIAPKDFLEQHARYHRRFPNSIVRGPIINITEYKNPGTKASWRDYSQATFCTCNASAPLKSVRDLGGFDVTFIEYGYEDNEMGWRLLKSGLKRHFNMEAIVYHYKPHKKEEDLPGAIRNAQELARSAVMYYRKHDDLKVRLATKITWFDFLYHKLFHYSWLNDFYITLWKKAAAAGKHSLMNDLEAKIRDYYYMQTLTEELKKGG